MYNCKTCEYLQDCVDPVWDCRKESEYLELDKKLRMLDQYHIERDLFCKIVEETIGVEFLLDAFCYGQFNCTDDFVWYRVDDEFFISHMNSGMTVNWYKHLGRTNTCSQKDRTEEDYRIFFTMFKAELEFWARHRNIKLGGE